MSEQRYLVTSSPHIRHPQTVVHIMRDVCFALLPAVIFGMVRFGIYTGYVMLSAVLGAVLTEYLGNRLLHRPRSIHDGSAVVTGILLAMGCPPYIPLWAPFLGSVFAIAIVKLPFGGLGHNFLNPALAGRAFMVASWPRLMTQWFPTGAVAVDAVSMATPLAAVRMGYQTSYADLLLGNIAGCIGEVCKLALIVGALYLLLRGIITYHTPLGYLAGLFVFAWIFGGQDGLFTGDGLFAILSGGAMMGALFMCTDYATSPMSRTGQLLMGLGAGLLTALIRVYGSYIEGVTYAILFMNVVTPLIDKFIRPKVFGEGAARARG